MNDHSIHIVALDIPDPPDYGGAIDMFYKVKALAEAGARIRLHAFQYGGRGPAKRLESWCEQVHYYPRKRALRYLFSRLPFVVASRMAPELLDKLKKTPDPILFEGLHTTGFIHHPALQDRKKLLRMHNVEWRYYQRLAQLESRPFQRWFYRRESRKLKAYEKVSAEKADMLLAISPGETAYFRKDFPTLTHYLPPFHAHSSVGSRPGQGAYALFHANLKIRDNERAAIFLAETLHETEVPLLVAGKSPTSFLKRHLDRFPRVRLIDSPEEKDMQALQQKAQLHVLHSFQSEGFKIKLLNALFLGRHVLANPQVLDHSGLEMACFRYETPSELQSQAKRLFGSPFTEEDLEKRKIHLSSRFDNAANAQMLLNFFTQ